MTYKNNKPVNTPIVLDLNKVDFEGEIKDGEIWQQDAVYEFNKRLEKTALQATNYKNKVGDNPIIIHDAIFIGGARGTGKTVFLQNIEGFWLDYVDDKKSHPKIYFCNSIDPTLLVEHDNFAHVVIAHLYNEVENKLESKNCENLNQDAFYNALRVVSKSLSKQEHLDNGLSGLDRIIQYRSGIQLVKHFDSYINECIKALEVDTIVLPIDDIDMALERSYEVLDVVRRLLGCPKIIPVITGDLELYEPIITNRFEHGENNKRNKIIENEQAKKLTQEYLKKVIPHHNRISLAPIKRLLPNMVIFDFEDIQKLNPINHKDYIKKLLSCFFGPLNSEEKSCDWPQPESAREVTQLIRDFSPSELKKENREELWQRYKVWACLKQDSTAYSNAVTAQKIEELRDGRNKNYVTLNKLHAFNPMLQLDDLTTKWRGKAFFNEQLENIDLSKERIIRNSRHLPKNLLMRQINEQLIAFGDAKIYRSMPAIEKLDINLVLTASVVDEELKSESDKKIKQLLLDTFTYNNYYDLTLKTKRQVFFSRAYEILASSLLNFNLNEKNNEQRQKEWKSILNDIYKRAPFYSIPAIFPTKAFNFNLASSSGKDEAEEQNEEHNSSIEETVLIFAKGIREWELTYSSNLKNYNVEALMPLIFSSFNKVFTQLKILRNRFDVNSSYKNETLSDLALRFKYITINAFATFIKPAPVVLQNVALTETYDNLRSFKDYKNSAPPIRDNVGHFFALPNENIDLFNNVREFRKADGEIDEDMTAKAKLLQAIAKHPIFDLLENINIYFILEGKQKETEIKKDDGKPIGNIKVTYNDRLTILGGFQESDLLINDDLDALNGIKGGIDKRSLYLAGMEANKLFVNGRGARTYSALVKAIAMLKGKNL